MMKKENADDKPEADLQVLINIFKNEYLRM